MGVIMQPQKEIFQTGWRVRDFVTLAVFNVVMIIVLLGITMLFTALFTPVGSYLAAVGVAALINGPVFLVMANKINQKGILFYTGLILGGFLLLLGYVYYAPTIIICGVLCELLMWGKGAYKNSLRNAFGYTAFYVSYTLSGVVPLFFFRRQYLAAMGASFSPEKLQLMLHYYGTPSLIILMCAISAAGALAGCLLGNRFLKKHVRKAKLI
jgi:energy-coupling factor transport system substrate-specific component